MRISDWSSDVCSSDLHWPVHMVVVPKKHIPSLTNLDGNEAELHFVIEAVRQVAHEIERTQGAAKVLTNLGEYQDSKHLRSEESRVGKEGVSTCRYRWSPIHE